MGSKLKKWRKGIDSVDIYPSPPRLVLHTWSDSLICDVANSYISWLFDMWRDSLTRDVANSYMKWLIDMWRDSLICDVANLYMAWLHTWRDPHICQHSYMTWLTYLSHHIWLSTSNVYPHTNAIVISYQHTLTHTHARTHTEWHPHTHTHTESRLSAYRWVTSIDSLSLSLSHTHTHWVTSLITSMSNIYRVAKTPRMPCLHRSFPAKAL